LLFNYKGDLDVSFRWDTKGLAPDFSLEPTSGFLKAGADLEIAVTFNPSPTKEIPEIRRDDVLCVIVGEKSDKEIEDNKSSQQSSNITRLSEKKEGFKSLASSAGDSSLRLKVSFNGSCIFQKPVGDPLLFSTPVREKISKEFTFNVPPIVQTNRMKDSPLSLKVVVGGDFFSAPNFVDVQPTGSFVVPIVFHPMKMTIVGNAFSSSSSSAGNNSTISPSTLVEQHFGNLFIPFPDGSGLLKELKGDALDPLPLETLNWEVICHHKQVFSIRVPNWSNALAHFKSSIILSNEAKEKQGLEIQASQKIDIGPLQEKYFRVSVLALKEGKSTITIRFIRENSVNTPISGLNKGENILNVVSKKPSKPKFLTAINKLSPTNESSEASQNISSQFELGDSINTKKKIQSLEYCFYYINITSAPIQFSDPLKLSSSVRNPLIYTLNLENPSSSVAHVSSSCQHPYVSLPHLIDLQPLSKKEVEIVFFPLDVVNTEVPLIFSSPQIGNISYSLHLIAVSSPSEKTMRFKTTFGGEQTQLFRFLNRYTGGAVDFKCSIKV
jgi:hypothetical protein